MKRRMQCSIGPARWPVVFLVLALGLLPGLPLATNGQGRTLSVSADRLHEQLRDYSNRFAVHLEKTAMTIATQNPDYHIRWLTALWKLTFIPACWDATSQADPRAALFDTWILVVQAQQYLETEQGQHVFGELTSLAREHAATSVEEIERLAAEVLTRDGYDVARQKVHEYAREHPVDWSGPRAISGLGLVRSGDDNPLKKTIDTVFLPFRSIGGLDQTALAIHEVARAAEEINQTAQRIPSLSRWNMELVLYQVEGLELISGVRSNLNSFADSAASLARTAQDLPTRLREELTTALTTLDEKQAGLQTTLKEAQATLAAGDQSLASLTEAANALENAIRTLDQFVAGFESAEAEAAVATDERPFDIREYTQAADAITRAARELQAGIVYLEQFAAADESRAALEEAGRQTKSLVTHITLCLAALVVLVFLAVLGVRRLPPRVAAPPPPP